jgi:D-proline reductase (dithiol) PrdB
VGLVARAIEQAGIPTFTLGSFPDMLALVRPPRAAWVRFPRGAVLGEPGDSEKHLTVLRHCLRLWTELSTPGSLVELPYAWRR